MLLQQTGEDEEDEDEDADAFVEGRSAQLDTERDLAAPGSVEKMELEDPK